MLDIEAIRKRAEAATKGPWTFIPEDRDNKGAISPVCTFGDDCNYYPTAGQLYDEADGEFIAHARTDIPALLDELERTRAAAMELREALKNEASNFHKLAQACAVDLSDGFDYALDTLNKTQWLEDGTEDPQP